MYMAQRVSPLLRKRVASRVAKLFINQNMNRTLIKRLRQDNCICLALPAKRMALHFTCSAHVKYGF